MNKVEIVKSKHVDFGMYGSDRRFMFTGTDGKTYIERIDFDNNEFNGSIKQEDGKLYFCFKKCALGSV